MRRLRPSSGSYENLWDSSEFKGRNIMSLIKCPECDREVSSKAPTCPGCGIIINKHVISIEKTRKKFKFHLFLSHWLIWTGLLTAILLIGNNDSVPNTVNYAYLAILVGVALFFITKIRIWWNHD